ncbi:hypothetical protein A0O30_22750 [Pseudomonas sp. LLC-1]|nr:hypothetical protein A0O30_22750 [Pseudomonas sp. LLC-1]
MSIPRLFSTQHHRVSRLFVQSLEALISEGIVVLPILTSDALGVGEGAKRTDEMRSRVRACQGQGMTKAEAVLYLKISRTTVGG